MTIGGLRQDKLGKVEEPLNRNDEVEDLPICKRLKMIDS